MLSFLFSLTPLSVKTPWAFLSDDILGTIKCNHLLRKEKRNRRRNAGLRTNPPSSPLWMWANFRMEKTWLSQLSLRSRDTLVNSRLKTTCFVVISGFQIQKPNKCIYLKENQAKPMAVKTHQLTRNWKFSARFPQSLPFKQLVSSFAEENKIKPT